MVGTVKDYYPEATIIGEQSFGKWSVQTLKSYSDGSTLKYTTAKWFTGKTKTWIDGVGITPDFELEFDEKRWNTFKKDNQLEKAISY
jgi:carboxyl-terminal processing protease